MRPRQWLKNVLVFGAPAAAGVLNEGSALAHSSEAFAAFCLAASGTYCVNDVLDRDKDRRHPVKRNRPIAAGVISVPTALVTAVVLFAGAIAVSLASGRPRLTLVLGIYVVVTLAYSKYPQERADHQSSGRWPPGLCCAPSPSGVAVPVALSNWFLIVACFGSLFVVTGKREAEISLLGEDSAAHRSALGAYTPSFLRYIRSVASGTS